VTPEQKKMLAEHDELCLQVCVKLLRVREIDAEIKALEKDADALLKESTVAIDRARNLLQAIKGIS